MKDGDLVLEGLVGGLEGVEVGLVLVVEGGVVVGEVGDLGAEVLVLEVETVDGFLKVLVLGVQSRDLMVGTVGLAM